MNICKTGSSSKAESGDKVLPAVYEKLRFTKPESRQDLKNYIKIFLGLDIPGKVVCTGHSSPLDYLWYVFSEKSGGNKDCIVWANRGGGKTELAAVATLLDCVFKPGCSVRILAGSQRQAMNMYNYLRGFITDGYEDFVDGKILNSGCGFKNASNVEVLTQSHSSVRGQHIQKLRCDELELFDRSVFEASKFVTCSRDDITAGMEMVSTMHKPYGLMQEVIDRAEKDGTPIFKWSVWEVIEKCRGRSCSRCPLWGDCGGKARQADGFLRIDDCISQMKRSSRAGWEAEMLCEKPNLSNAVFAGFDPEVHVGQVEYDCSLPVYRAIDFGFVNPFVCLWIQVDEDGVVRVFNEYTKKRVTVEKHCAKIKEITPCAEQNVSRTFCDPAGRAVNDVTGTSPVRVMKREGINVTCRASGINEGIELIRRKLTSGDDKSGLIISLRCRNLIRALRCYHYPDNPAGEELPVKDGEYDHYIDALRYFFVNYERSCKPSESRRY
jgi:hypothetical protein